MDNIRCCVCEKYCKPVDESVGFGEYNDLEPPDPDFYCKKCARAETKRHIQMKWVPQTWQPAEWHFEVAKKLGYGRAGLKGGAWAHWFKKNEPLPSGYTWWTEGA